MAYKKAKNKESEVTLPFKLPLSAPQRTVSNKYFLKKGEEIPSDIIMANTP